MATEVLASNLFRGPDRGSAITSCCGTTKASSPTSAEERRPRQRARSFVIPAFVNAHRSCAPDRVVVRRGQHAAGKLDPALPRWARRWIPISTRSSPQWRVRRGQAAPPMMVHYTRPSGTMPLRRGSQGDRAEPRATSASASPLRWRCATKIRSSMAMASRCSPALAGDDRKTIEEHVRPARRCRRRPISS